MNNQQQHLPILLLVLIGALVVGLAGTCIYEYWTLTTTTREITTQRENLRQARRRVKEQAEVQIAEQQLQQKIARQQNSWSWSEQLPIMVSQVTRIVEDSGAKIDTLQPEPLVTRQQLARFPLRMTLHAELGQLTSVLSAVTRSTPLLSVDHLNIQTGEKPGDPLQVELTLSSFVMLDGNTQKGETH